MTTLFRRAHSRASLLSRVGDLGQVAGVRVMTLSEGREAGVRIADVRTGSGLRYQVTLDRGMDISMAEFRGTPLAWRAPCGDVHPAYYDPAGIGWLRSFPGGLLTGCGITQAGAPCTDEGETPGLHGRLSHTPAEGVAAGTTWQGDEATVSVEGTMREYRLFGENMMVRRTIASSVGSSSLMLTDHVVNEGSKRTPLMMLYHINIGWPMLDESSQLLLRCDTVPRDEEAARGLDTARRFSGPVAGYKEQVFYHRPHPDEEGWATAALINRTLDLCLYVRFRTNELPRLAEWKMLGEKAYVLGLEPSNCATGGRAKERAAGTLQFLDPGAVRDFAVECGVLDDAKDIAAFVNTHGLS